MKMKKLLSGLLAAVMVASMAVTAIPAYASDTQTIAVQPFQTSSRYDIGIAADNVRLGWKLEASQRGMKQKAYHVVVKDAAGNIAWDSGWVESPDQTGVCPQNLKPETVYFWQVNIRDEQNNESGMSEVKSFETAPAQLDGQWIGGGAQIVKTSFTLDQDLNQVDRARAYVGSTSLVETRMNGQKVGELVLAPKKPVPDVRVFYNTHDVLPYLQNGQNTVGIMLGNVTPLGGKAIGMVKIYYKDGSTQVIGTGPDWRANSSSPVTRADFFSGEDQNPNLFAGWDTNEYTEDSSWTSAQIAGASTLYCKDGKLVVPENAGIYYTKESFSGDYTIEAKVSVQQNAFGLLFGSGNPNPALWQFNVSEGSLFKMHNPGNWVGESVVNDKIQYNTDLVMKIEVIGNTVKSYLGDELIDTRQFADGQTSGPLGIRATISEAFTMDYLKVTQNGAVIWEDNFDKVDSDRWTFPADPIVEPAVSASKVVQEVQPVSIYKSAGDSSKPHVKDGQLILPTNCGIYYTKESFSGDYTIELETTIRENAFGLIFGSGSPNAALWQMNVAEGSVYKTHQPGDWSLRESYPNSAIQYNVPLKMRIEVVGNTIKSYLGDELVNTCEFAPGQTSGPLGLRATIAEAFDLNYIRVIQGGETVWEDNFDTLDTDKWTFPAQQESYVVDFGKNMSGYVRMNLQGERNSTVTVHYSELANADGSIYANTTFHYPTNTYTLTGGSDTFEPKFFSTGFRYVQVDNFPGELTADNITACFVSDDLDETGSFTSSNDRLNQVYDMYRQSQISNLVGNYTDCPQREKDGWTGDASVIKESAAMLLADYTSAEAYMKTMYDNIYPNGQPLCRVPKPASMPQGQDEYGFIDPTWTSAYFVFPYETYLQTGDKYYIEMAYDSMMKVFQFYQNLDTDRDYIITNNQFGDWLGYDNQNGRVDRNWLSTAYVYYAGNLLSKMTEIIGKDNTDLNTYLKAMYTAMQDRFNQETYFSTDTQTANSMAVDLGIAPPEQRETIIQSILGNVSSNNTTLMTGVLGTKSIYDTLSAANEHKTLVELTTTPNKCSFGYMLDNGATTLWEYWDKPGETFNSNNPPGDNRWDSQNHAMMGGGPGAWVYQGLAGIRSTAAGYSEITYRPGLESELSYVNGSINTIKGLAESKWTYEDGELTWDVTVPANATATILIPIKEATAITESGKDILGKNGDGLTYAGLNEEGFHVYTAGSGSYRFTATDKEVPPPSTDTDKTILDKVIRRAEELQKTEEYLNVIPMIKESFDNALAEAKAVNADADATQEEINTAWIKLVGEVQKLSFQKGDKSELQAAYDAAVSLDQSEYQDGAEKDNFNLMIANAKAVLDDENAIQNEIDKAKAELELAQSLLVKEVVDKSELKKLIDTADTYVEVDYLPDTWAPFAEALKEAKDVYQDDSASMSQVREATNSLLNAMGQLRYTGDKSQLNIVIEYALTLDLSQYTESSAAGFTEVLSKAQDIQADTAAAQPDVRMVTAELVDALLNLRYKADKSLLEAAVSETAALDLSSYTEASLERYNAAKAEAERLLADNDISSDDQQQINAAAAELKAAVAALVPIAGDAGAQTNSGAPKTGEAIPATAAAMLLIAGASLVLSKRKFK